MRDRRHPLRVAIWGRFRSGGGSRGPGALTPGESIDTVSGTLPAAPTAFGRFRVQVGGVRRASGAGAPPVRPVVPVVVPRARDAFARFAVSGVRRPQGLPARAVLELRAFRAPTALERFHVAGHRLADVKIVSSVDGSEAVGIDGSRLARVVTNA